MTTELNKHQRALARIRAYAEANPDAIATIEDIITDVIHYCREHNINIAVAQTEAFGYYAADIDDDISHALEQKEDELTVD